MTKPATTYAPQTLRRSATCLMTTAVAKVPHMIRAGKTVAQVEAYIFVAGLLADDLLAEAEL